MKQQLCVLARRFFPVFIQFGSWRTAVLCHESLLLQKWFFVDRRSKRQNLLCCSLEIPFFLDISKHRLLWGCVSLVFLWVVPMQVTALELPLSVVIDLLLSLKLISHPSQLLHLLLFKLITSLSSLHDAAYFNFDLWLLLANNCFDLGEFFGKAPFNFVDLRLKSWWVQLYFDRSIQVLGMWQLGCLLLYSLLDRTFPFHSLLFRLSQCN